MKNENVTANTAGLRAMVRQELRAALWNICNHGPGCKACSADTARAELAQATATLCSHGVTRACCKEDHDRNEETA